MSKQDFTPIDREIPVTNEILAYFQCKLCTQELPEGQSPSEWTRFNVGWTKLGLQVWCTRHEWQCHPRRFSRPEIASQL